MKKFLAILATLLICTPITVTASEGDILIITVQKTPPMPTVDKSTPENMPVVVFEEGTTTEPPILTLEEAISVSIARSDDLEINERKEKSENLNLEEAWRGFNGDLSNQYDYKLVQFNLDNLDKEEEIIVDKIKYDLSKLFDDILIAEKERHLQIKTIDQTEKDILKAKIMEEAGMASELQLSSLQLQLENEQLSLKQLEDDIDEKFEDICNMMEIEPQRFVLEKPKIVYEEYEHSEGAEHFLERKADTSLSVWQAEQNVDLAEIRPVQGLDYDYYAVMRKEESIELAEDNIDLAKEAMVNTLDQYYLNVKQIEDSYSSMTENIDILKNEMLSNKIKLDAGTISKLDFAKSELQYEQAEFELEKVIKDHYYLKLLLDNTDLI
ncbi:hypothetical protein AN640_00190 [Candidatus Epulonipiscium fishelsonii]|uniref:Uncharacterized protein n=1 Tax=Candidatus Epulonipiscium fishelsonii TaxID=77094 RepID=A0ACC8XI79_9FIRM|nr:hypothetical protein AN640_00190 [Epulopiscium sp. SCG-D08WGA-EpuloA1]